MLPAIRTGRMLLRPWQREGIDALHALWLVPEVRRYLGTMPSSHVERHNIGY